MTRLALVLGLVLTVTGCSERPAPDRATASSMPPATGHPSAAASGASPASLSPTASPIAVGSLRGTLVYSAETDRDHDVFLLNVGGSEPERLTDGPEKEFDPDLSPDGDRIAYRRNPRADSDEADIWVMNIDGSNQRNLTNAAHRSNWAPAWTPDGRIAYSSASGKGGALELWTMDARGGDARRVSSGWCEYAQPSPDGSEFVCAAAAGGSYDIVVVQATTGERRSVTTTPMTEFGPTWSPDGQWIVFSRDLVDRWALMRIRPDGSDEGQIATEGVFATWDPDGHVVWSGPGGINVAYGDGSGRIALDYPAEFVSWGESANR